MGHKIVKANLYRFLINASFFNIRNISLGYTFPKAITISKIDGKAAKCNLCVELLDAGLNPACVDGCPVKCLQVGNVTQVLAQKASASKQGIGYSDGPNKPNMIIIRERK